MTDYAFKGQTIRLNQSDYDQWKKVFYAIPDFDAELFTLDAFYTEQEEKKWFVRCSRALLKAHNRALVAQRVPDERAPSERSYATWTDQEKRDVAEWIVTNPGAVKNSRYLKADIERLRTEGYLQPRGVAHG